MCDPCCLIIGCTTHTKEIRRPPELGEPPAKLYCPECSNINTPVYKRDHLYFTLCFIPLCPCGTSDPYMACSICGCKVNSFKNDTCSNCEVTTPFDAIYCPNCGKKKKDIQGEPRKLHIK